MAADPLHYRRRFAVAGAFMTLLEAVAVGGPLVTFYSLDERQRRLFQGSVPIALAIAWVLWWVALRTWRAPLDRAVRRRRAGEILDRATVEDAYAATLTLPRRLGWLRAILAGTLGVIAGIVLVCSAGFPLGVIVTIAVVTFLHTLLVQVFRVLLYARVLGRVRDAIAPDIDPLRLFRDQYFSRLLRGALATGALGVTAIAAFTRVFLPVGLEEYVRFETWFPFTVIGLCGLWWLWARRVVRPIDRYLAAATSSDVREQPAGDDPRAVAAYRAAQSVPYKFAVAKVGFWLVGEALLVAQGTLLFGVDLENAVLMFSEAVVVTVGVALYEALWHRATMRPLLAHVATRHRPRPEMVRTPLSLRNKMLISFGGLTFFACGLSLFWSFVQYKNLATGFIQSSTELRLERILSDLKATAARSGRSLAPDEIAGVLQTEARDEVVIYYLSPAEESRPLAFGGGKAGPPPLAWTGEALMRRLESGQMDLSTQHLTGAYARLYDDHRRDLGSIAVLLPGYRGRGPSIDGQIKVLVYFFFILASASMGIVLLVVRDLTGPIRLLEQRAGAMARGDLTRPVIHVAGEADEVGRLTFAFEEMRRALNEKLRSSTEINLSLELEVQRRTSELENRNHELKDALDALRRAQDELVRSEKLASMGRLVAGIAHEINNPVNAVVNTASPLESTLEDLMGRLDKLPPEEASEIAADVREMIRVIQRGARRTKEIVQALHNYSRGDDDRLVEVDLQRGIDDSLDLLRHHLKHNIRVERDYGDVGRVRGYAGQLHQVFMNLLTNAAQALNEESEHVGPAAQAGVIRITTARVGGKVVITVADNGPGIPPDVLPHIFDPFFTTKEVGKGSGLGLSIVHSIVERHGGTIAVESTAGGAREGSRGTRFTVTLPSEAPPRAREGKPERAAAEVVS